MITNLIFDLSGYGGSANFTATTTTDLINELNTLTGVTWYWDPADCKPKSNFYPGVPPVITTAYKVSFVDIDGDSTGFCNAGSLDYTKFTEIDLSGYGGSATTQITNATDIINAFAALTPSLTVSVSGCSVIINNWDRNNTPTNVEVNNSVLIPVCFSKQLNLIPALCGIPVFGATNILLYINNTTGYELSVSDITDPVEIFNAITALNIPGVTMVSVTGGPVIITITTNGTITSIGITGCPSGCSPLSGCQMDIVTC